MPTGFPCIREPQPLPASVELHVGIEEANNGSRGHLPALKPGTDQTFPTAVAHNLHEAWIPFVNVLVQVELEFH